MALGAQNSGHGRRSLESLEASPCGVSQLFGVPPAAKQQLYVLVFTSPDGKQEHVKVGRASDVNRRLKEVRTVLLQTGHYDGWSVACRRAELLARKHEEEVHARLRRNPKDQAKGYPSFKGGSESSESKEMYALPYVFG